MRVISQRRLMQFWALPGLKGTFANASLVGTCVVFNVGGNKGRLVARVLDPSQKVFVLKVMTHAEYDEGKWKEECGCFEPSPVTAKKTPKPRKHGD